MNTIQEFKQRKIQKAQLGTLLKKGWNWLSNAAQIAAIAESPAVMAANGWTIDSRTGKAKQDSFNTPERNKLADNLATIGEAAATAPTLVGDVGALVTVVRHPVQTGKTVWKAGQDALWFLKNPRATKVYHVNRQGKYFPLQQARTGSPSNIGIHVTPKKEIAQSFNKRAPVMEAYIPKHDMETIDIWGNDYNLFSNDYKIQRTNGQFSWNDPRGKGANIINYSTTPTDTKRFNLIKKYGGNPSISNDGYRLYLDNDVTIPLQKETWPDMPIKARQQMDEIIKEGRSKNLMEGEDFQSRAQRLNQQAAKIASDNGKKVIKYNNANPSEGGGGTSYIITDPSVFYNPQKYNWQQIMNRTKYPIMYGTNQ